MKTQLPAFCLSLLLLGIASAQDSLNVRLIGSCGTPGFAFDLALNGDYAYVADGDWGLRVISVADPANPVEVGHFDTPHYAHDAAVIGNYVYIADGVLQVISVVDPTQPTEVGCCQTDDAINVAVSGNYAYVANGWSGFSVVSITDPSNPVETGHCDLPGGAYGVAVSGDYAFVAANGDGLRVISIVDSARPTVVACCSMFTCLNVALKGACVFVTNEDGYLRVVDVSAPTHPVEVGSESTPGSPWGVAVSGTYAYLADGIAGVWVISIADTRHPCQVGYYDTPGNANGVTVAGGYVYVCDGYSGLEVYQFYGGGVEETPSAEVRVANPMPMVVRGVLWLTPAASHKPLAASLLDAAGRKVAELHAGANDVSWLAPGVYFCRLTAGSVSSARPPAVTKVVIAK